MRNREEVSIPAVFWVIVSAAIGGAVASVLAARWAVEAVMGWGIW